jgi:hypothetical protein
MCQKSGRSKFSFGFSEILDHISNGYGSVLTVARHHLSIQRSNQTYVAVVFASLKLAKRIRDQERDSKEKGETQEEEETKKGLSYQSHSRWKQVRVSPKTRKKILSRFLTHFADSNLTRLLELKERHQARPRKNPL